VTKDTAERNASSPPTPTSRATVQEADPRARDPRRAARRKRPPKSGGGDARTIARSDTARAAPRADPAPTIGAIFFCSSVSPHGRPALFPNAAWASFHNSKGHRNVDTCAFFLFRPAFVASDRFYSGPNRL
jgi:hypothetical protein